MIARRAVFGLSAAFALVGAMVIARPAAAQRGTPDEAKEMVASAIALYQAKGEAAFATMNRGAATGFLRGDLYIFVFTTGPDAKVVVQAFDNARIGIPVAGLIDSHGRAYGTEMLDRATAQGAWVDYRRVDPATGKDQAKTSWVVLYDGHIFGCGVYKAP